MELRKWSGDGLKLRRTVAAKSWFGIPGYTLHMMSEADEERASQILAGAIILAIGVVGGAINISALLAIYRSPSFHNAFGMLCASHLISDIGFLVPHIFWAAPAELMGWPASMMLSTYADRIGQLLALFCTVSLYSQLQISINRLVAILAPLSYNSLFSPKRTIYSIVLVWLIGLLRCSVYFLDGCTLVFKTISFTWNQSNTPCGRLVAFYLEYVMGTTVCVIVIIVNTITFIMIYKHTKKLSAMSGSLEQVEAKMHKNNLNFFLQSFTKAALFAVALIIYFFVSKLATTKWETFLTRTVTWEVAHCVNGLIIFIFNDSFRKAIRYSFSTLGRKTTSNMQSSSGFNIATRSKSVPN
ncbi:hypothetical protein Y032_0026g1421 [Ancylostoma ceylanicum]|uniref:G-protein coupled receptors family 1 profile domain-containing protein n=1 Tax=Ancylostoma ceylanicum TaxID=53326 RepID=A0A016UV66_9BILA|nr:hypothetical protein Y032_0026g1421 [Ancylostoma ceylanicum]